jgi:hypothetical protein
LTPEYFCKEAFNLEPNFNCFCSDSPPYTCCCDSENPNVNTVYVGIEINIPVGIILSEYAPGEANTPIVDRRPVLPTAEHRRTMIQCEDCAQTLFFIASQNHSMSVIQLPAYQPFGGMPPQISSPWLAGLSIGAATLEKSP